MIQHHAPGKPLYRESGNNIKTSFLAVKKKSHFNLKMEDVVTKEKPPDGDSLCDGPIHLSSGGRKQVKNFNPLAFGQFQMSFTSGLSLNQLPMEARVPRG